jgi:hypothetical protein
MKFLRITARHKLYIRSVPILSCQSRLGGSGVICKHFVTASSKRATREAIWERGFGINTDGSNGIEHNPPRDLPSDVPLQLIENGEESSINSLITLTHRWGSHMPCTLRSNRGAMKRSVKPNLTPQKIRQLG